ncbi:MAG: hypothetical protein WC510_07470 [Candidatus Omnitrophota bacterium]
MSIIYEALKKIEKKDGKIGLPGRKRRSYIIWVLSFLSIALFVLLVGQYIQKNIVRAPRKIARAKSTARKVVISEKKDAAVVDTEQPAAILELPKLERDWTVNYTLEGIIYDRESPLVIINGKILKEKDRIDNFEIRKITPDSIELLNVKDGATVVLTLPGAF